MGGCVIVPNEWVCCCSGCERVVVAAVFAIFKQTKFNLPKLSSEKVEANGGQHAGQLVLPSNQCDQIWRIFPTMAKFSNS